MIKENIPEYSITELSTALKSTIEDKFGYVRIKGELSGVNNHSSGHIYLTLKDENAVIPIDAAIQSNLRQTTTKILSSLTPREERVLRMRFGIGMNSDHTLEEVGQQFSVTRERIRQIEAKALRKLKHPSRSRKLRSFLDT